MRELKNLNEQEERHSSKLDAALKEYAELHEQGAELYYVLFERIKTQISLYLLYP